MVQSMITIFFIFILFFLLCNEYSFQSSSCFSWNYEKQIPFLLEYFASLKCGGRVIRYMMILSIAVLEMLAWTPYCPKDKRLSSLDNRVSNLAVISMNFKKIKLPKIKELIGDSSCEISFKNINSFSDKIEEINQVGQLSVHAGRTPVQPAWTYVCPEWIGIQPAWTYVCPLWTYLCPTSNFIETKMCLNFSHHANTLF